VIPFVTVGGGVISNTGGSPEFSLQGDYTVQPIGFTGQIAQRDRVDVRYTVADHAPIGLVGFGVRYAVSERWVLRFEGRGLFSESSVEVKVDAAPQSSATGGAFAYGLVSSPTVQFSSIPISPSSLSGPLIADFVTFSGSGLNAQFSLTAGLGWRF
jgi:hypothetical protein